MQVRPINHGKAANQCLQGRLSGSDHGNVLCGEGVQAVQAPHLRPCRSQDKRWRSSQRASLSPTRLGQQDGLTSSLDACACGETHACTNVISALATSMVLTADCLMSQQSKQEGVLPPSWACFTSLRLMVLVFMTMAAARVHL